MPHQCTTKPLQLLQINTQRSNFKTHTILNKTAGKYNILLIQEPWIGEIGSGNRGLPAHKAWQPFIPIQSICTGDCPRVLTYIRHNRSDLKVTLRSDLALDPDFQILEIMQKPHTPIFIINIYNGKDTNNIYTIDRIKQIPVPVRGHLSVSLPPLSSPTLPLFICILPTPLYHLQGPHPKAGDLRIQSPMTFWMSTHQKSSTSRSFLCLYLNDIGRTSDVLE
jgi:hypothetical protein